MSLCDAHFLLYLHQQFTDNQLGGCAASSIPAPVLGVSKANISHYIKEVADRQRRIKEVKGAAAP